MSIDWNWFFSSFCQSAAALIGIIGAFIISRLLSLGEKVNTTISEFDNYLIEANKIKSSISKRRFYWYTKTIVRYDPDIKEGIRAGEFEHLSKEEIIDKIVQNDNRLYKVDDAIMESFNDLYENHKPIKNGFRSFPIIDLPPDGIWARINQEKDNINELEIEAQTLISRFNQNLQELNSFENTIIPLKIIIIMLMFSFPLTVIYPLHFMPISTNQNPEITFNLITIFKFIFSLKFCLLLIFFGFIEGIFYYFLTLTNDLSNSLNNAITNNSENLRDIKNYSKYF